MRDYLKMAQDGEINTIDLALEAVRADGNVLKYLPSEFRTYMICMTAVHQEGMLLEYVPVGILDPELCFAAVANRGWAFTYVPEELRTVKLYRAAMNSIGYPVPVHEEDKEEVSNLSREMETMRIKAREEGMEEGKTNGIKETIIRTYQEIPTVSLETLAKIADTSVNAIKKWILGAGLALR